MEDRRGRSVSFLLTDIAQSTRYWEAAPDRMRVALARHDLILRQGIQGHGGRVLTSRGEGDSFFAVFPTPSDAVGAACAIQRRLAAEAWPEGVAVAVRMAVHTGQALRSDLRGPAVNRCARIRAAAHGGQVLVSEAAASACDRLPQGAQLLSLGKHRLRDLTLPERIFQLRHPELPADFPPIRSLSHPTQSLPAQLTTFIGRTAELAMVKALVGGSRLVTLTGVGGSGKTRLALETATELVDDFEDGVFFVDLGDVGGGGPRSGSRVVAGALADALQIPEQGSVDPVEAVAEHLRRGHQLLVLDNCEHLVTECAAVAERLVQRCLHLRLLCTSREPLGVIGEVTWRVPPLSLPSPRAALEVAEIAKYDAIEMFVDRARLTAPEFALTGANARVVVEICRRVDGIPLAIELAASAVRAMTVEQLVTNLADHLNLPERRTAVARQQTLEATIDWSYELLTESEKALFVRLAVFRGGFSFEAAQAVCGNGVLSVQALLGRLVDKSLVSRLRPAGRAERLHIMEVLRQYASARLDRGNAGLPVRNRHLAYFSELAVKANDRLRGPDEAAWLDQLEQEHDNLRASLEHARTVDPAEHTRLTLTLYRFWLVRGHFTEGRKELAAVLSRSDLAGHQLAEALNANGVLAWQQGDLAATEQSFNKSLAEWRAIGSDEGVCGSLNNLGNLLYRQGDFAAAGRFYTDALQLAQERGHRRLIGILSTNLGLVLAERGDDEAARRLLEESRALQGEIGEPELIASSLINLGVAAVYRGDLAVAAGTLREALAISLDLGDEANDANALEGLAWLAIADDRPYDGLRLAGAAAAIRGSVGIPTSPAPGRRSERLVERARDSIGGAAASQAWKDGGELTWEEMLRLANTVHDQSGEPAQLVGNLDNLLDPG
jgi:predicted ATPase/class 3 adenylate cyclase